MKLENHIQFNFNQGLMNAYQNTLNGLIIIQNKFYFASPFYEDLIIQDQPLKFYWLKDNILFKQNIIIGKNSFYADSEDDILEKLRRNIFFEEISWLKYFLKIIELHHEKRYADNKNFLQLDAVQTLFGEVIIGIHELDVILKQKNEINQFVGNHISQCIFKIANILAKLFGGRSMLSSSIIELLCTFQLINKMYLW